MSLLVVAPESLVSAAADVQSIGSALKEANVSAAVPTTGLLAAGADEVSAAVAARIFSVRVGVSGAKRPGREVSLSACSDPWLGCGRLCQHRGRQRGTEPAHTAEWRRLRRPACLKASRTS